MVYEVQPLCLPLTTKLKQSELLKRGLAAYWRPGVTAALAHADVMREREDVVLLDVTLGDDFAVVDQEEGLPQHVRVVKVVMKGDHEAGLQARGALVDFIVGARVQSVKELIEFTGDEQS